MELKPKFKEIVNANFKCTEAERLIDFLFENKIVTDRTLRDYMILHEYHAESKKQEKNFYQIRLDLSVKYDVSETTVRNIIYAEFRS